MTGRAPSPSSRAPAAAAASATPRSPRSPIARLRRAPHLAQLRTSDDEADRVAYARDLWPRHHLDVRAGRPLQHKPDAIVWPSSTEELAALVRWAARERVPLVPFGAGSGVCGGVLPGADAIVVDLKRMDRIRAIDAAAPLVDVEAGRMGVPLEQALGRAGFTLGHFPSSILCSTVGGWVATRSAGQSSGAYGKIEDMVVSLECVTGDGEIVHLRRRERGPDLASLVIGSEGTLAVVASAKLRLHPAPTARTFGAWSFPTTGDGLEAMRALFQSGLRPAVARLYDPFDAMLARRGGVKPPRDEARAPAPGRGGGALRTLLKRPHALNELLDSRLMTRALGGAMLIVVFEGGGDAPERGLDAARRLLEGERERATAARASRGGRWVGAAPAERWLAHRYAVSYRQAPVFANGAFVDTMEVAAPWSRLGGLYEAVRRALGDNAFVMAHFSHAYPDGCCIYFSFAGGAGPGTSARDWDTECEAVYDRTWRAALAAAVDAGGTLAHHHGVGRSKAARLVDAIGTGADVVRAAMRAFDPSGILNPGNLVPRESPGGSIAPPPLPRPSAPRVFVDRTSLLASVDAGVNLASLEQHLVAEGLTLDVGFADPAPTVRAWLESGAPGARDRWLDPADQVLAGLDATLADGRTLAIAPAPRRAVGPDLTALFVGAGGRFGRIDRAWLRVHLRGVRRPESTPFHRDRDAAMSLGEAALADAIADALAAPR
jgi:alkyldihydroxyacetonephosphate synthase